ncbi:MAG: hypothetical protein P4L71_16500 [Acetobacteraceae bacterium]|nr:hypothetical protein [Acetobacteraceae bacterium]
MSRLKMLDDALRPAVPKDVMDEAKHAAGADPCWIAMLGAGHVVATEGPGSPDVATGDVVYIADVAPREA